MPQINLLPWRQLQLTRRRKEFGIAAFGALLAAAAVMLFTSWGVNAAIDRQHDRNELLKREIAELDKQIDEIKKLKDDITALLDALRVELAPALPPATAQAARS